MGNSRVAAAIAIVVLAAEGARAQTPPLDPATLGQAREALAAAEDASKQAKASAEAARKSSLEAERKLAEARRLMAALTTTSVTPTPAATGRPVPREIVALCPDEAIDIRSIEYFRTAPGCERRVLASGDVNQFKSRSTTGVGTSIAAASSGASATLTVENVSNWRSVTTRGMGLRNGIEQQRVSRRRSAVGLRADIGKDDKSLATIATFGELDRLTSKVALFARYGHDYSTSEAFRRYGSKADGVRSTFVEERAGEAAATLTADCLKAGGTQCSGLGLVRWIFENKEETRDFTHPEAVKLYNSVFWGAPTVDTRPRYGWSIRGEISRPTFDYYPFVLARVADPFRPGKFKSSIDPAQFPTDFASKIVTDEDRINFALTGRAFLHLSNFRSRNAALNRNAMGLLPFVDRTSGTTIVGTASFVRNDEIQKPFRDVRICPASNGGQSFTTDQTCTTLNIAAPVRKDSLVLGAELRQGIEPLWILPPVMVAPRLTRDFSKKENGLVVPLYLATDLTGTFTGGLRFAQTWGGRNADGSDKKAETLIGVVIGVSIGVDGTTGID
jgi:hypothetical protein